MGLSSYNDNTLCSGLSIIRLVRLQKPARVHVLIMVRKWFVGEVSNFILERKWILHYTAILKIAMFFLHANTKTDTQLCTQAIF